MAIAREELKHMDFRDVATGKRLAPVHPGDVLMRDFIEPMGITRYKVAKLAKVQQRRIDEICRGERAIVERRSDTLNATHRKRSSRTDLPIS